MENINIELHDSVTIAHVKSMSACFCISTCKPEKPTSSNDRHLSHRRHHRIPANYTQRATIILSFYKYVVHNHQQTHFVYACWCIHPLCSTHQPRVPFRADGQRVVDHADVTKTGGGSAVGSGGFNDPDGGGVGATNYVMEVETKVAQFLFSQT